MSPLLFPIFKVWTLESRRQTLLHLSKRLESRGESVQPTWILCRQSGVGGKKKAIRVEVGLEPSVDSGDLTVSGKLLRYRGPAIGNV